MVKNYLITGGAGFIGSNLVEFIVKNKLGSVTVLDDLSTGSIWNIQELINRGDVDFIRGDIRDYETCEAASKGKDYVIHLAALGSIPRSINDPLTTNAVNVNGFLNVLGAVQKNGVKRLVYASSSSVYGDDKHSPKLEESTGNPLSPYAVTKRANELYAEVFAKTYGTEIIGLRLFNVFGPKQNIDGPYAAVIPIFMRQLLSGNECVIFGDGKNTRDFTYVENVIHALLSASQTKVVGACGKVFNIACGETLSILEIYRMITDRLEIKKEPQFAPVRQGDILNSLASIDKAKHFLNYLPKVSVEMGIAKTVDWYKLNSNLGK